MSVHPADFKPMKAAKAKPGAGPGTGENLRMEVKLDGWRCIAHRRKDGVDLRTSTGEAITSLPYLETLLRRLPEGTVLDGELVDLDGATQWNRTQSIASKQSPWVHEPSADNPPLTFAVFDTPETMGDDLRTVPLEGRRAVLELLLGAHNLVPMDIALDEPWDPYLRGTGLVRMVEQVPSSEATFEAIVAAGGEGVIVKDLRSLYREGSRKGWTKHKGIQEVDALCTGTFLGKGRLEGWGVGGVTFLVKHDDGTVFDGRCAGMTDALRRQLHDDPSACTGRVVEIRHWGIMDGGALRFPQLRRIREAADKSAADLGLEA